MCFFKMWILDGGLLWGCIDGVVVMIIWKRGEVEIICVFVGYGWEDIVIGEVVCKMEWNIVVLLFFWFVWFSWCNGGICFFICIL